MDYKVSHILPSSDIPVDVWLSDDPELALVHADMSIWADAHPCNCEALCECDEKKDRKKYL